MSTIKIGGFFEPIINPQSASQLFGICFSQITPYLERVYNQQFQGTILLILDLYFQIKTYIFKS